ncbi:restriction endonuclease subunit S [Sinorhizobium sp. 8-89]|uniref:restriction endonuclease subunit S n=1 Tax=Sinorhizobium sp. 7-81 TaxID=3049087 RepID=UPI0024C2A8F8|nr:restriction endonuclease subunit S [Sinorhizobium sp. 7-81]MDK1386297.1 restriction endonuclease subunit S [Sinorhizobium sp. 7-81]
MSFPRHKGYKPSGSDWMGDIPSSWDARLARRLFKQMREAALEGDEQLSATQRYGVVPQRLFMELEDQKLMLALGGIGNFKHVEQDDFVISLRSFQGGIEHSAYSGCVSPAYTVLRARDAISPSYFAYALKCSLFVSALQTATDGIRDGKNISYDQFGGILLPVPPLPEQAAISAFLDREVGKIDALVEEQKRLIELLKEKRQAVVSHAVTKGLNPDAPMKNTGIEWLGEVPEHWQVSALKTVATVQTGIAKGKDFSGVETIEVPYLRVANVQDGYFDLAEIAMINIPGELLDRYRLRQGDVLMNEGGDFDKLGRGHVWDGQIDPCIHQNHVFAVRPHSVLAAWLNLVAGSDYAQFYFVGRSKQSTNLASISSTNLMELPVTRPPEQEQIQIVEFIHAQIDGMDGLMQQALSAIELLQERRTALIDAAVTGKIDVRGLVETREAAE